MKYSILKKTEYLRISANTECNLNCKYCHNEGEEKKSGQLPKNELLLFTKMLFDIGVKKIKFIGGEPMLRKDLPEIISAIRSWSSSLDISIITNGVWPERIIEKYLKSGVTRINVSLHQADNFTKWNSQTSEKISPKDLAMINALNLKDVNLLSKVNFVLMKNYNEKDLAKVINWAGENRLIVDVLNMLYPQNTDRRNWDYHYTIDEIERLISETWVVDKIHEISPLVGLPSKRIHLKNSAIINLKTSQLKNHKPYLSCENCPVIEWCEEGISAIRITVDGKIKPCLFRSDNLFNLKDFYKSEGKDKANRNLLEYLNYL